MRPALSVRVVEPAKLLTFVRCESVSMPTLAFVPMFARAASVDTEALLLSPVLTSVVPTTSFTFAPEGPPAPWTSKSVSGRMRYIVPSFQSTSAVPFGPVLMKSPSPTPVLGLSVSHVLRFAFWIWTSPAVSTTFALLFTPAPAMIFNARDFTSTAVRAAFSFEPAARSLRASPSISSAEAISLPRSAASFCCRARTSASSASAISCLARIGGLVALQEEEDAARDRHGEDDNADQNPNERLGGDVIPLELGFQVARGLLGHNARFWKPLQQSFL